MAIAGATGQLGRALTEEFSGRPEWQLRLYSHDELEITERESIAHALGSLDCAPEFLINTAFWPDEDPVMGLRTNALGPRLLAEWCAAAGTTLVHISTDYVFDGEADRPYRESDCPNPRSVYGTTKLAGEQLIRASRARHLILRISSLYGPGGSRAKRNTSFVSDMLNMHAAGKQVRVVTDQYHSPTYAPDAALCIRTLLERDVDGTFHISNTGSCSKYEYAQRIFQLAGVTADLVPITIADLPQDRHWPRYTVLAHDALERVGVPLPRPWEEGLHAYLHYTAAEPAESRT